MLWEEQTVLWSWPRVWSASCGCCCSVRPVKAMLRPESRSSPHRHGSSGCCRTKDELETLSTSHRRPGAEDTAGFRLDSAVFPVIAAVLKLVLTCPQALQWWRLLVMELNGSWHFMHRVTSFSLMGVGARFPSSTQLWGGHGFRKGAPSINLQTVWSDVCFIA